MIPYCHDAGIGLLPWSPLARGALARPFGSRDTIRERSDRVLDVLRSRGSDMDREIILRVEEIAKKKGVPMATIATAWCLTKKDVNPILGLNSKERVDQAVASLQFMKNGGLTQEDIQYLEEPYVPQPIFGY